MPRNTQLRQNGDIQLRALNRPTNPIDLGLDMFITAKEAERCTPRTVETYRFTLNRFCDWLATENVLDARGITPHHIRLFLAGLDNQGLSAGYIHIHARVIKTWVRLLHAEDMIPTDSMAKVATPRLDKTILPAFTAEGIKHLLNACATERDKALMRHPI